MKYLILFWKIYNPIKRLITIRLEYLKLIRFAFAVKRYILRSTINAGNTLLQDRIIISALFIWNRRAILSSGIFIKIGWTLAIRSLSIFILANTANIGIQLITLSTILHSASYSKIKIIKPYGLGVA